jgi:peptidoglycan/LPS O-acetylase OafA/YrhL
MKRLSTHRDALMGVAILWIMLFHAEVVFPSWLRPLTWLHETGYGGVDIFLFLSGLGLYYSMARDPRTGRFYRSRFLRILPTYWVVILLATAMEYVFLHRHTPPGELFYILSTVGFWINAAKFDWYIPSIVVLYLLFPLFFRAFRHYGPRATGVTVVFGLALSVALVASPLNYLLIFSTRIAIFVLGVQAGYMIREGRTIVNSPAAFLAGAAKPWVQWILFFVGLGALAAAFICFTPYYRWQNGTWWYPFVLITPALCNGIAAVLKGGRFERALAWCGRYSLEIYLVHTLVFGLHKETARFFVFDPSGCVAFGVYALVSLPLAWLLQQVMARVTHLLTPTPTSHV